MAILKKRTSSKQLPEARGLDRAPLGSVIRDANNAPSISGGRSPSITSTGGSGGSGGSNTITSSGGAGTLAPSTSTRPSITSTTKPTTTKPAITTKPTTTTKPTITTKPTTTTKPSITTKTPTTPTTKTTSPTSVVKPVVTKPTTKTNSTTNKIVNALTGAALGVGTKLIIDKITGKPVVAPKSGGTAPNAAGSKTPPAGGSKTPPAGGSKTPPAVGPKAPPAGGTKTPPAGGGSPITSDIAYKGTPADESLGLPAGAIDNGDRTYTTVFDDGSSMTFSMENNAVLYSTDTDGKIDVFEGSTDTAGGDGNQNANTSTSGTRGIGGTNVAGGDGENTVVAGNGTDAEYFLDDDGNYYTMTDGGSYELAYYADGSPVEVAGVDNELFGGGDTEVAENTDTEYFEDSLGNVYAQNEDGTYELYANADGSEVEDSTYYDDTLLADNEYTDDTDYSGYDDYLYAGNDDYTDYEYDYGGDYYGKRGGLIAMMKKGGVPKFADGDAVYSDTEEEVQDWQNVDYNYGENDDPVLTGSNSLYSQSGPYGADYLKRSTPTVLASASERPEDVVSTTSEDIGFSPTAGVQYFDDGSYIQTFDDGSTITVDSDGNVFDTTEAYETTRDDAGNFIVTDGYGNMTVYDPSGNIIPLGGGRVNAAPIVNVGSGTKTPPVRTPRDPADPPVQTGISDDLLKTITGALGTTAGAAGAGALVASLLGSDFMGGGSGAQNQGLDMSQVGLINPRTTDFGIGPTNFVGYDQYGTDANDYTPNEELLRNLNAPGYNPVREGDYGYEETPVEESADAALPAMASGGLSSMSTPVSSYYTFGQPADILANLGMRPQPPMNPPEMMSQVGQQQPPQQAQQQGLPQQMPPQMAQQMPQGMPQQGMMPQQQGMPPPMRRGGLPHASNVPITQGRMDFRRGSAVHGAGDGQSDDIPAMLADGEYVIDAETVAQIGNGSTKAGAQALDKFREGIRAHKRSAPINKIPPKTKALTSYLKGAK